MLRWAAAVGAAAAALPLLCTAPAPAGAASFRLSCAPRGATVIASSGDAVVFRRPGGTYKDPAPKRSKKTPVYYGCWKPRKRAIRLGINGDCFDNTAIDADSFRLAGRFVAFAYETCALQEGGQGVMVFDLDKRRRVTQFQRDFAKVGEVVLGFGGTVAWTWAGNPSANAGTPTPEVHKAVAGGPDVVVDRTPGIDPSSLALTRRRTTPATLFWTVTGVARNAPL